MAHEAFRDAQKTLLKMQAQLGVTNALVQKLMAHRRGDEQAVAEQARYEASYRNLVMELDARGTGRGYSQGQIIELRAGTAEGVVSGWASTSDRDLAGHEVVNGAFAQSIKERGLTGPKAIKVLLDHDWTKPAGVIRTLEYRAKGLFIEVELDLNVEYVRDRYSVMQKIQGFNFSVGFVLQDFDIKTDRQKREYLEITRADLFEVSLVAFPCNEAATLDVIAGRPAMTGTATQQLQSAIDTVQALNRLLKL